MKRLALILALLLTPALAKAQGQQITAGPFPNSGLLYVCPVPSGGTPCPSPSSIFKDSGLTQTLGNPIVVFAQQTYTFYAAGGQYTLEMPASGVQQVVGGGSGGGSSTPTPGVFQSTFDPPLFQCYSAASGCQSSFTATGTSTAIDLRGNPIDTHTISWRLGTDNGLVTAITDTVPYANGDLHTANANWVYQTGSFTVASNVIYGNAGGNVLAYRGDGPNTANEWAQATMTITAVAGQSTGPCVRVQTAANTAYCLTAASNFLRLQLLSAGSVSNLGVYDSQPPVTGDVLRILAQGSTIMAVKCPGGTGCFVLGFVTDANITSGETGIFANNSPATQNGENNFQSGTFVTCNVQIDTSEDNANWNLGLGVPSQSCVTLSGSTASGISTVGSAANPAIGKFVRINVTTLGAGQTLDVVYSGRLAPAPPTGSPVSNGQWVNAGEVIWAQFTGQVAAGVATTYLNYRLQVAGTQGNGTITQGSILSGQASAGCFGGGQGFGLVIPQSGYLVSASTQVNSSGFPQGSSWLNMYVLPTMPSGGSATTCSNSLTIASLKGSLPLAGCGTGSFYFCSFVGTTNVPTSPWAIPGYTTTLVPSTPAAGAELTFTFISSARTCVQSVYFTLAAGSGAVTPVIVFTINGSKLVYPATTSQASGTQNYSFSPGAAETVTAGATVFHIVPFNNGQLICTNSGLTTLTLTTVTTGLNGTTAYTNPSLLVQVQQDNN